MEANNRRCFILLELIIYLGFLAGDLFGFATAYLKYLGIVLCFLRSLHQRNRMISLAFAFTLCADFFLLLLDRYYVVGVCFFIIVQIIYLFFLLRHDCRPFLFLRAVAVTLGLVLFVFLNQAYSLNLAVLFYFMNLFGNALSSFTNPKLRVLSLGFILFVCCDICVGLNYILPPGNLYQIIAFGMWFFYLPSQVLICLGSEKLLLYKNR
ncbi:MAG: hypothetical protein IJI44_06045 [Erysipelotrichaceae bacterium]|nr:hypothetical protein [Erysipelotrichaceae bacterium]